MQNPKNDQYYLSKLKKDLGFILDHMKGMSEEDFGDNEILQDSMMFRLIQISENAAKLSKEFKERAADIPWGDIYGLRNRIVHDYGKVDLHIVYVTLARDIPELSALLEK